MKQIKLQTIDYKVFIGTTEEHTRWHKKNLPNQQSVAKDNIAQVVHYTHTSESDMSFVVLDIPWLAKCPVNEIVNIASHEATHIKQQIYEYISGSPGREDEAYYIGFFAEEIYNYATIKIKEHNDKSERSKTDKDANQE